MTQAKPRFATFKEYLSFQDEHEEADCRYELINGELVALPPESRLNAFIANRLFFFLINAGVSLELLYPHQCEVQVPVLQPGDAQNRYPDLVLLREEHLALTTRRLTITLEMPPPAWIVEVVSPGSVNHNRDYIYKLAQYAAIGVEEYWIVDPQEQVVQVYHLLPSGYEEVGAFREDEAIASPLFAAFPLNLTANAILGESA
ncbi:MAG: Uma2 family endonuclease [Oculatellaceae cyanobacterium Prado106]|jgi:Uma2 family endonuclease|nr:Uma2 family endonuclease [Oculatellaceae cyanobacterium Prado106]